MHFPKRLPAAAFAALCFMNLCPEGFAPISFGKTATAQEDASTVRGIGIVPCSEYLTFLQNNDSVEMLIGWIDGFVSGLNAASPQVVDYLPWQHTETVAQLLADHCTDHPDRIVVDALSRFIQFSRATRLTEQSEVVRIPVDGQGNIEIMRATLRQAQEVLSDLGHYTAAVDGAYGPGTAAAFRAFQADRGFPETGLPDQTTLLNLFLPLYSAQPAPQ